MTYVVTETCIDLKDKSCIEVCPVDCIHEVDEDRMVFIDPDECIDCGACVDPCPVDAIYAEEDVPAPQAAVHPDQQDLLQGQGRGPRAGRRDQAARLSSATIANQGPGVAVCARAHKALAGPARVRCP